MAILLRALLPLQGVPAAVAVTLLSPGAHLVPGGTSRGVCGQRDVFGKDWIWLSSSNVPTMEELQLPTGTPTLTHYISLEEMLDLFEPLFPHCLGCLAAAD